MGSLALNHDDGPRCRGALTAIDVSMLVDCLTPREQSEDHVPRSFFGARDPTARASSTAPEKPPELFLELDTRTLDSPISSSCPQTTSPGFDFDQFGFKFPLFTHSKPTTDLASIDLNTDTDNNRQNNRNASTTSENHLQQLFYTFLQSPATSTTSLVLDTSSSSDITSCLGQEQKPAMPGQTLAAPVGSGYTDMPLRDYFATPSTDEDTQPMSNHGSQPRPRSRSIEGKTRRSASPIFTLWGRRHQHQQRDRPNRSSSESKPNSSSGHSFIHKRGTLSRSGSIQKRHSSQAGMVPQMTREEFEALPLAIQRKVCALSICDCILEIAVLLGFIFSVYHSCVFACRGYPESRNPCPPLNAIGYLLQVSAPAHEFTRPISNWKSHLELPFTRWHQNTRPSEFSLDHWAIERGSDIGNINSS